MGGSTYSKDWGNSYHSNNFPSYTYVPTGRRIFPVSKDKKSSLNDIINNYINSNIHKGIFSLTSDTDFKAFFDLVEHIIIEFRKIDKSQAELLNNEFKKIKSQYRHYKLEVINAHYFRVNKNNSNDNSAIKAELSTFINWLDNILMIYDLLPDEKPRESADGR